MSFDSHILFYHHTHCNLICFYSICPFHVIGLIFGAIASFFLSRELHTDRILLIQSEEELNSMGEGTNRSMGSMGSIAPSDTYSQHGSQHDISDHHFHEFERANSMESNPKNITNRIGSRIPFSIDHQGIGMC